MGSVRVEAMIGDRRGFTAGRDTRAAGWLTLKITNQSSKPIKKVYVEVIFSFFFQFILNY